MDELNIEKFDPTVADLKQLVEITSQVVVTDINDKAQIDAVKNNRIILRDTRVRITRRGKELREDALKFQKAVIAKENELIEIIKPEETRLKKIEEEVMAQKERAERIALLPMRKEELIKLGIQISDEVLVELDAVEFKSLCNTKIAEKNEATRLENEKRGLELKEKEDALRREKDTLEREEKARQEERGKAEQKEKDRIEHEKFEAEREKQRLAQEQYDREIREKAEKEALEKREVFIAYLKSLGWTEENKDEYLLQYSQDKLEVKVYKLMGVFNEK